MVILALALTLDRSFYQRTAVDAFLSLTLASTAIIFVSVRPAWELIHLAGTVLALSTLQLFVLAVPLKMLPAAALVGISSLLLLAVRRLCGKPEESRLLQDAVVPPFLFVLLGYLSATLLGLTTQLHPRTLDWLLYSFDGSLGVQPSFKTGQVVLRSLWLTRIALVFYYGLPVALMLTYARQLLRCRNTAMIVFLAFFVTGPLGIIFYNLLPACGPIYLVGRAFPFDALPGPQLRRLPMEPVLLSGARNAFPSLHMGWALLNWWYSEGLSFWTRLACAVSLAGTVLSTLGLGEHYFVDLVAAFPFALMIRSACAPQIPASHKLRIITLLTASFLMLAWILLLRFGLKVAWESRIVPWLMCAGTIALCLALQAKLRTVVRLP